MGLQDGVKAKALRGLGAKQPGAVAGAGHPAGVARPERIGHRKGRSGAGRIGQRIIHGADQRGADAGSGGVMDQHTVGRIVGQGHQSGAHRARPGARSGDHHVAGLAKPIGPVDIIGMHHDTDTVDPPTTGESVHHMVNHPLAGQGAPLLGQSAAGTGAAPGGHDQRGSCRHVSLPVSAVRTHRPSRPVTQSSHEYA